MAKKANTTMIGGFVVIAFFLLAASVVILGSGKFFKRTENFVLHFDGSIQGLNVGAPVLIRGVQVGSVTNIVIHANRENLTMNISVYIEIELDRFHVDDPEHAEGSAAKTIAALSGRGLRAVLSMQSLITGQLAVELDYYPDSPVNLKHLDGDYPEIPTIPSPTTRLLQTLQQIDFVGLAKNIEKTMVGIDRLANNPDLVEGLKALRQTADESRQLVGMLDNRIDDLFDNFESTLTDTRTLVNNANGQVQPVVQDMRQLINDLDELTRSLDKKVGVLADSLNESLTEVKGVVSEDAPLVIQLEETLQNISSMTDSIRQLTDYLEQHPESLLRGKQSY